MFVLAVRNRSSTASFILFPAVPVPLGDLSECKIEKKSKFAFFLIVPIWVLEVFILEDVFLVISLPLALPLLVLDLFVIYFSESCLGRQLISHVLGILASFINLRRCTYNARDFTHLAFSITNIFWCLLYLIL